MQMTLPRRAVARHQKSGAVEAACAVKLADAVRHFDLAATVEEQQIRSERWMRHEGDLSVAPPREDLPGCLEAP